MHADLVCVHAFMCLGLCTCVDAFMHSCACVCVCVMLSVACFKDPLVFSDFNFRIFSKFISGL